MLSGSGQITGSSVLFSGGKIGGWDIGGSTIESPNNKFRLDATSDGGTMRIGTNFGPDGPISPDPGIYLAGTGDFAFVQDVNTFSVPIGTAIIAGVLRDKGHEVDLFVDENKIDKTIFDLNKFNPQIIGMSVTTGSHVKYIEIAKEIAKLTVNKI